MSELTHRAGDLRFSRGELLFFEDFRISEVFVFILCGLSYGRIAQLANASSAGLKRMYGRSRVRSLARIIFYFARCHLFLIF